MRDSEQLSFRTHGKASVLFFVGHKRGMTASFGVLCRNKFSPRPFFRLFVTHDGDHLALFSGIKTTNGVLGS